MIRKLLLGAGALSLVAAVGTGIGANVGVGAASASSPVTLHGKISCFINGNWIFSVPLRDAGSTQTSSRIFANLTGCFGAGATHGPVTVVSGILELNSTTTVANNCGQITAGEALPTMTGHIAWTATGGTAVPTSVTVTTPYVYYVYNYNILQIGLPTTLTMGSYAGQTPTYGPLYSNASGGELTGQCSVAAPGLPVIFFGAGGTKGRVLIKAGI